MSTITINDIKNKKNQDIALDISDIATMLIESKKIMSHINIQDVWINQNIPETTKTANGDYLVQSDFFSEVTYVCPLTWLISQPTMDRQEISVNMEKAYIKYKPNHHLSQLMAMTCCLLLYLYSVPGQYLFLTGNDPKQKLLNYPLNPETTFYFDDTYDWKEPKFNMFLPDQHQIINLSNNLPNPLLDEFEMIKFGNKEDYYKSTQSVMPNAIVVAPPTVINQYNVQSEIIEVFKIEPWYVHNLLKQITNMIFEYIDPRARCYLDDKSTSQWLSNWFSSR